MRLVIEGEGEQGISSNGCNSSRKIDCPLRDEKEVNCGSYQTRDALGARTVRTVANRLMIATMRSTVYPKRANACVRPISVASD